MYREWTQTDYQNKHYNINQKDEGTLDDRGRDGGTNFILRIKEQETRLTLQEHDDDDDDDDDYVCMYGCMYVCTRGMHVCKRSDDKVMRLVPKKVLFYLFIKYSLVTFKVHPLRLHTSFPVVLPLFVAFLERILSDVV